MAYQQLQTVYIQPPQPEPQGQCQMQPQYVHVQTGQPTYAGQVLAQPQTAPANQSRGRQHFAKDSQKRCGILQIVLGVLAMVIGVIMIPLQAGYFYVGTGIWCGVFMVIAGSFGVWSAHSERTGPIVTCMVISILASVFGFVFFCMSAVTCRVDDRRYMYRQRPLPYGIASLRSGQIAVDAFGMLVGLAEIVVGVVQSVICCRTTCCGGPQPRPTIVYVPQPFPAQYALQTHQGVVQATNIPAGSPQVTVIQPCAGCAVHPAVGHPGVQQGYAPQQGNVPQQGCAQQQVSQPGPMQDGQPRGAEAAAQCCLQGPIPPAYSEKPPTTNPE